MEEASQLRSVDAQWARVRGRLRAEVGEAAFKSWLNPLTFDGVRDGAVKMVLPTRFMRDHVMKHYAERLKSLWSGEIPDIRTVEIGVAAHAAAEKSAAPAVQLAAAAAARPALLRAKAPPRRGDGHAANGDAAPVAEPEGMLNGAAIQAPLDPRLTFQNVVVGK